MWRRGRQSRRTRGGTVAPGTTRTLRYRQYIVDSSSVFGGYRGVDERANDFSRDLADVRRGHLLDELQRDVDIALLAAQGREQERLVLLRFW